MQVLMKKFTPLFLVLSLFFFTACNHTRKIVSSEGTLLYSSPPKWAMQGNIYEVNIRQYTPEGTFNAFAKHLDRLKEMGVQTLWFMPINPISVKDRKGTLGSYYAVSDYTDVNPEFGTMADWNRLVGEIHHRDMKVMIDWVPNHTGADHRWLSSHPNFYVRDSAGKFISPFDWTDVKKLNYNDRELQDSMIAAMKFWVKETGIDGYRVDHVDGVRQDFWDKCIAELKEGKNLLMLAESEDPGVHMHGFDMSYAWRFFHTSVDIAAGRRPATSLDTVTMAMDTTLVGKSMQLFFTSNHDENSWNKADYGTMPGASHAPFAVLTATMYRSVPLIYSGQEEPVLRPLQFFEKDPIVFSKFQRAKLYKTLLDLRKRNEALTTTASFNKVSVGDDRYVYAFVREHEKDKVLVILNLSAKPQNISVKDESLLGNPYNVFMGMKEPLTNKQWQIEPWGYVVYEY
jgi:alpha-amylase